MLINNLLISKTVCELVNKISPSYLLYLSSDAVYSDSKRLLYEKSVVQPNSLHGIMHYAREVMLKNSYKSKMCIVRPTLVYGKNDPHNGYGPNRFIRLVKKGQNICADINYSGVCLHVSYINVISQEKNRNSENHFLTQH